MTLSLLLAALSLTATPGDTLSVNRVEICCATPILPTYATDSTTLAGKTFDLTELLQHNKRLTQLGQPATRDSLSRGAALTVTSDSLPVLRKLRFTLEAPRFVEGQFVINHLAHYALYIDGTECTDKRFALAPGRAEITLLTLTQRGDRDTLSLSLTGKDLNALKVNAQGPRPYTMRDMVLGAHYAGAQLSPTGRYLLTQTYYTQPDGKNPYATRLTERATGRILHQWPSYVRAAWQDDTDEDILWFDRTGDKGRELVKLTPADDHETVVADGLPEGRFTVSPHADYLIFNVSEDGPKPQGALKALKQPDDRQPGWRDRNALWRYDLQTGLMQRLTFGQASVYLADISRDGRKLLVQYNRFDAHRVPFDRTTLVSLDAYTGRADTLLADTTYIASATFAPDAKRLLIQASPAAFDGIGSEVKEGQTPNMFDYRLYLYDPAKRETKPLLRGFAPAVDTYDWPTAQSPIYFSATEGFGRSLFALDPVSGKVTRYALPVSYLQGFTVARASGKAPQAVIWGQTATRARDLYSPQLSSAKPCAQHIGEIDFDKLISGIKLGTCHSWKFLSSRGDSIDGFYILPPDFDASKHYPAIVYYYGGCVPTVQCLEYQYPLQVLAGQGYVVYALNPSGATGYGQEFAARHVNTWGQGSGDDIIEGTRAFCAAHPFVDAKKVGCMGASYGGFMTEYLQTRTDIFAAAVSHAGISNITSYWGGGYWGYSYGECAQFGSYPWNNPDLYVKQSPLFSADKIHTPLLMLHGTADTNVPPTESLQLYTALKILGRDVALVQVDGENHVITNLPKRLEWQNAIFAWFAKYLKGDDAWWKHLNL